MGYGNVILNIAINGSHKICKLRRVLRIPYFAYSLISVGDMAKRGIKCNFDELGVNLVFNGLVVARGYLTRNDL